LSKVEQANLRFDAKADIYEPTEVDSIIRLYRDQLSSQMDQVIGESAMELKKQRTESTLGNWVADALLHQSIKSDFGPVDIVVQNYGGLRIPSISKGPVTRGKIFELMPFDNELLILEINGEIMQQLFERMAEYGGWPMSKGNKLVFNEGGVFLAEINGHPIKHEKIYRLGISDYIANGGDDCDFLVDQKRIKTGLLIRDLLLQEVIDLTDEGKKLDSKLEGRTQKK
jgi:2',3'-cyclic-nucleotide 2'-phosphodiesterase (5'-nucleotidase family)